MRHLGWRHGHWGTTRVEKKEKRVEQNTMYQYGEIRNNPFEYRFTHLFLGSQKIQAEYIYDGTTLPFERFKEYQFF